MRTTVNLTPDNERTYTLEMCDEGCYPAWLFIRSEGKPLIRIALFPDAVEVMSAPAIEKAGWTLQTEDVGNDLVLMREASDEEA